MWKYVSRRIRDVYDKTANVLEVRRTWNCGQGERFCADNLPEEGVGTGVDNGANGKRYCLLYVARPNELGSGTQKEYGTGSNSYEREGFKRKEYHHPQFEHSWLGAITWHLEHPTGRCVPSQLLRAASERGRLSVIHCEALSQYFGLRSGASATTPCLPPSNKAQPLHGDGEQKGNAFLSSLVPFVPFREHEFVDYTSTSRVDVSNFVFQINHDRKPTVAPQPEECTVTNELQSVNEASHADVPKESETVDGAFKNLLSVLGEIEFELGRRNLELGEYSAAVSHLKLGASHQHAGAAFNLGICYEQGYGIPKDMRLAMECYQLAADQGHPQAMYNLGVFYARGLAGLRQSRSTAKKYFIAAAELGLEEAIAALGPKYQRSRKGFFGQNIIHETPSSDVEFSPAANFSLYNVDQFHAEKFTEGRENVQLHLVSATA
uniref:Uncharacterized protein n=1 Tax=Anopheles atroparvus TaxID=41427 RepID=A0A182IJM5_ANOAO